MYGTVSPMSRGSLNRPALMALASSQSGVVTRQQAKECGASTRVIQHRLESGEWTSRFGCLVVSSTPHSVDLQDARALALRLGRDAIVTGPTAIRLRYKTISSDLVLAAVPTSRNMRIDGVQLLRDGVQRTTVQGPGYRIASFEDAFLDTLTCVEDADARRLIDESLQLHQIQPHQWLDLVAARAGRHGVSQLRRLSALVLAGTHSHGERKMKKLLVRAGLRGWVPNFQLLHDGRIVAELDFARSDLKLCIEVDGRAFHIDDKAFQRDRLRQNELAGLGWLVLRFTWEQITQRPELVIAQIKAAIAQREFPSAVG